MDYLVKKSNEAIRHYDDVEAKKLLKKWSEFIVSQNIEKTNPQLFQKIQSFMINLKIVAFPQLPDSEAADILRFHYLESFNIEISMDNRLTVLLFSLPEIPRDELREKLKRALMKNEQNLGRLSVSQWIAAFEKEYPVQTRTMSASVDFAISNTEAKTLDAATREKLKELLHTYDYFLVTTLPNTGSELNEIINSPLLHNPGIESLENTNVKRPISYHVYREGEQDAKKNIEALLNEALKTYPDLGEQLITSNYIRLKSFPEPVRPSIKNWISDYTFNLGFGEHNSMERGNYLYKNDNAQVLGSQDKERLSYILKAVDENQAVAINTTTKQVIFPQQPKAAAPQPSRSEAPLAQFRPTDQNTRDYFNANSRSLSPSQVQSLAMPAPKPSQQMHDSRYASPLQNNPPKKEENISFSTHQTLPYEKAQNPQIPAQTRITPSAPIRQEEPKQPQPLRIHSIPSPSNANRNPDENRPLPKNVVNLKEQ